MAHNVSHLSARLQGIVWFCLPFQLVVCSAILIKDWHFEYTRITGSSMAPTLSPDFKESKRMDGVLWNKRRPVRVLKRGDVVLFDAPHKPEESMVKRVVALGGDTVILDPKRRPPEVQNGVLNIAAKTWDVMGGKFEVPEGHVWVEGDNWRETHDSNWYGPISESLIQGKAMFLVSPWRQFRSKPWEEFKIKTRVIRGSWERKMEAPSNEESQTPWQPYG